MNITYEKILYTGNKVYDPMTNTESTGYWVKVRFENGFEEWIPIWEDEESEKNHE